MPQLDINMFNILIVGSYLLGVFSIRITKIFLADIILFQKIRIYKIKLVYHKFKILNKLNFLSIIKFTSFEKMILSFSFLIFKQFNFIIYFFINIFLILKMFYEHFYLFKKYIQFNFILKKK